MTEDITSKAHGGKKKLKKKDSWHNRTLLGKCLMRCKWKLIYKIYSVKDKRMDVAEKAQNERCFRPIWPQIKYLVRGNKYVTVNVQFHTEEWTRQNSVAALKINELIMQSIYFGRCASKVRGNHTRSKLCLASDSYNIWLWGKNNSLPSNFQVPTQNWLR